MKKLEINTRVRRLLYYINDFEKGLIRVPAFQRDFEWDNIKKVKLFESIKNGYPIGSILFWRPDFIQLDDFKNFETDMIGSYHLPERAKDCLYILDGYQRLSTLFGCLVNPEKIILLRDDKTWKKHFNLIYDLENDEIKAVQKEKYQTYEIPLYRFVDGDGFYDFQTELFNNTSIEKSKAVIYMERYKEFGRALSDYAMPSIDMNGGTTEEAIEIFTRLNSEGARISNEWILSALSFDKTQNFRLGSEIANLIIDVKEYDFEKLPRKVYLQCITNSFDKVFFDKTAQNNVKKLKELVERPDFIQSTNNSIQAVKKTIIFLRNNLYVFNNKILSYNNQLIFLADFFNKIENPSPKQLDKLKKWFWITTYSNYFTIYNLSKQRLAYQEFQAFIKDENHNPVYYDNPNKKFETVKFPKKIDMGSVRAKALGLFMLQYQAKGQSLDTHRINGYKEYRLFQECNNPKDSENTVLIIDDGKHPIDKFTKDLSDWLNSDKDYSAFFITAEMQKAYQNGTDKETILVKRRQLIIEEERKFVESFNIEYIEE
jgi:uncharacterized protein with ParB-like and HNH nuclease domain